MEEHKYIFNEDRTIHKRNAGMALLEVVLALVVIVFLAIVLR